jgi:hypothetical protein
MIVRNQYLRIDGGYTRFAEYRVIAAPTLAHGMGA